METTWRGQNLKKTTLNLISKENLFYKKSLSTPPFNSILNVCSYVQGSMLLRRESDMGAVRELKTNGNNAPNSTGELACSEKGGVHPEARAYCGDLTISTGLSSHLSSLHHWIFRDAMFLPNTNIPPQMPFSQASLNHASLFHFIELEIHSYCETFHH